MKGLRHERFELPLINTPMAASWSPSRADELHLPRDRLRHRVVLHNLHAVNAPRAPAVAFSDSLTSAMASSSSATSLDESSGVLAPGVTFSLIFHRRSMSENTGNKLDHAFSLR
jgi:hypothetical protein